MKKRLDAKKKIIIKIILNAWYSLKGIVEIGKAGK